MKSQKPVLLTAIKRPKCEIRRETFLGDRTKYFSKAFQKNRNHPVKIQRRVGIQKRDSLARTRFELCYQANSITKLWLGNDLVTAHLCRGAQRVIKKIYTPVGFYKSRDIVAIPVQ